MLLSDIAGLILLVFIIIVSAKQIYSHRSEYKEDDINENPPSIEINTSKQNENLSNEKKNLRSNFRKYNNGFATTSGAVRSHKHLSTLKKRILVG